jgi:hypothetical protein
MNSNYPALPNPGHPSGLVLLFASRNPRASAYSVSHELSGDKPCHRFVTHSRNQEETGGHRRTRRRLNLSTGGHERKRRDTRGHDIRPVRDREAPDHFRIQNRRFESSLNCPGFDGGLGVPWVSINAPSTTPQIGKKTRSRHIRTDISLHPVAVG